MRTADEILESLKNRGHRMTTVRKSVISFLSDTAKPVSAQEILFYVHTKTRAVNKTTVYREINFLLSQKIIAAVSFGDGKRRYEMADLPHHHHAICTKCEKVEDVLLDGELSKVENRIYRSKHFRVNAHIMEFFGICEKCAVM